MMILHVAVTSQSSAAGLLTTSSAAGVGAGLEAGFAGVVGEGLA